MIEKLKNPFRYLSLTSALIWGSIALILTSVYCWQTGLALESLTQISFHGHGFWCSTVRQVTMWLFFSLIMYVSGVLLSHSKVRFQDVAAFTMFARIPYDLMLLLFLVPPIRQAMTVVSQRNFVELNDNMVGLLAYSFTAVFFIAWFFYWGYKGFSEATNLKGGRGIWVYALCFVIAFFTSPYIIEYLSC